MNQRKFDAAELQFRSALSIYQHVDASAARTRRVLGALEACYISNKKEDMAAALRHQHPEAFPRN